MNKLRLNIGGKLFIAIAGSSLLVAALAFVFFIPMDLNRMKQINHDEAHVFIKAFNKDFIRVIFLNTTEESVNLTEHLRKFPLVESVILTNTSGEQLFTYFRLPDNDLAKQPLIKNDIFDVQHVDKTISYMGENYGHIDLTISNSRLNNRIEHYYQLILPLVITLIIVAFGVARILRNYFAKPIMKLSSAVNDIAENRIYSKQIHTDSKDEIGLLCKGFNDLLSTVSETQISLAKEKEQAVFTLNSITDAVIRTDHLGNIEYMNPAAVSMTGHSENGSSTQSIEDLLS